MMAEQSSAHDLLLLRIDGLERINRILIEEVRVLSDLIKGPSPRRKSIAEMVMEGLGSKGQDNGGTNRPA